MIYTIQYNKKAQNDTKRISHPDLIRIKKQIEHCLITDPKKFGKPLRNVLKNCWSLRVGKYRVVYEIHDKTVTVLVIAMGKRETIYSHLS